MDLAEHRTVRSSIVGEAWVDRFVEAVVKEDVPTILTLLSEDAVLISDGGGKATTASHPIQTRDRIIRFLLGLTRKAAHSQGQLTMERTSLNGQVGLVIRIGTVIDTVILFHTAKGICAAALFHPQSG